MNDSYLCIDIGTNSIKVLEKDSSGTVLKWGYLERKSRPFHSNITPLNEADAIAHLKMLLEKIGTVAQEAVVSLPDFLAFTMIADRPDPQNIPAAPETFHFQAFELSPDKFFLVAIPNDVIEEYTRIFQKLNLRIRSIELESFVLARVLGKSKEPTLIINFGDRSTSFVVAKESFPYFISKTDFGVASREPGVIPHITGAATPRRFLHQAFIASILNLRIKNPKLTSGVVESVAPDYVWDVIINKVKEIAAEKRIKNTIIAKFFDSVNGL